jgi:hypothetical protein
VRASKSGARDTEILVDHIDLLACPAELDGAGDQGVLPRGRFAIELNLGLAGLAQVDAGGTPEMHRLDLGALSHHAPPPVSRRGQVDLLRKSGEFPVSNEELDDTATTVYEGI